MDIHYIDREQVERTISVVQLDSSYRYQELMGEHSVTLNFDLPNYIDFPVGAWIQYENEKYRLFDIPDQNIKQNERHFEYTLIFYDPTAWMSRFKMRNIVDGRLAFTLTAQPQEYIDAIVENLNSRDTGVIWRRGDCIVGTEKTQSFAHNNIKDALTSVATLYETEWQAVMSGIDGASGKTIYDICLKKVEYNKITAPTNNAQRLMYGKMNGLLPGINRSKGEGNAVDVVWVEGGDRNINSQTYTYQKTIEGQSQIIHANKLHLPTNGTFYYVPSDDETQKGYVYTQAEVDAMPSEQQEQIYSSASVFETDEDGFGLHRRPQDFVNNGFEESLSLTDIYPCLKLNVSEVILEGYDDRETPDVDKYSDRFWNIRAIDNPVNYNDYMIGGEEATIIFNSGMLAGKEFNLADTGDGKIYRPTGHEFLIQPTEIDGIVMPDLPIDIQDKDGKSGTGYIPQVGDEFAIFHIELPQEYIDKAEKDLLLEACNYLYKHGEIEVQFSCNVDGIFSRNKWESIRQYFIIGGYINFVDDDFCRQGRLLRILAIKDYLNRPHAPELTLSNSTISQSVSSELKKVAQNQVFQTKNYADAIQFSKRNFREAQEAQNMINKAYSAQLTDIDENLTEQITQVVNNLNITNSYFTENINPATIQTMSMLIGDKNLQFAFGHSDTDTEDVVTRWTRCLYQPWWEGGALHCPDTVSLAGGEVAAHVRHDYWTANKDSNVLTVDAPGNHPYWIVNAATLRVDGYNEPLDANRAYYLYLQAPSGATATNGFGKLQYSANFVLYSEPHPSPSGDDFYFLVGILNAYFGGSRSYVDVYSSVEITGGMIRLDKIVSQDGDTYIDLINNTISGRLVFHDGLISSVIGIGNGANASAGLGGINRHPEDDEIPNFDAVGYVPTKNGIRTALWASRTYPSAQSLDAVTADTVILQDGTIRIRNHGTGGRLLFYADPARNYIHITTAVIGEIKGTEQAFIKKLKANYGIADISAYTPFLYADNFIKQFEHRGETLKSFVPSLVWGGGLYRTSDGYAVSPYSTNFSISVTATREDVGIVTLHLSKNLPSVGTFVTAQGWETNNGTAFVTIKAKAPQLGYITVKISDDQSTNDYDFEIQIWYVEIPSQLPGVYDAEKNEWIK